MSTKMHEEDWALTLLVFRACLTRRGREAEDDRLFLEALRLFRIGALTDKQMHRVDAWRMIQRRAADLGLRAKLGCTPSANRFGNNLT
jgi:hypothetical protein